MDILFVRPNDKKNIYGELSTGIAAIEPPVWALILASFLEQRGFSVGFRDPEANNEDPVQTAQFIEQSNPVLVCIVTLGSNLSASTWKMAGARVLIEELRRQNPLRRIMLWGLHPSALPERTMHEENVDFVCQGEGFLTLTALLPMLKAKAPINTTVPGLWYRNPQNPKIIEHGPCADLANELSSLPLPAWHLASPADYRAHNWHCFDDLSRRTPYATIYTSLGCPFACSFCALHALFGKSVVRFRPPVKVLEEIDLLVNTYGVRNIKILDECFVLNHTHVNEICDRIIAAGYNLNIWAYARIDTIRPELLQKLKRAGVNWLAFGIESGDDETLAGVQKRGYDQEKIRRTIAETKAAGIHVVGNFMFGLPNDTLLSMQNTLKFAMELNCEYTNFYVTMAYPGSQLYNEAVANNIPLPDSWIGFSQYSEETLGMPTQNLSGNEVLAFRDMAFRKFHSSPEYLRMLELKFGLAVADHMKSVTEKSLKRKYASQSAF